MQEILIVDDDRAVRERLERVAAAAAPKARCAMAGSLAEARERRIEARQGQLSLSIRDNGRGFASESTAPSGALAGMGLRNMQARAPRLGGALEIHSGPTGTLLALNCPIDVSMAA